jgi:hypothetical protein
MHDYFEYQGTNKNAINLIEKGIQPIITEEHNNAVKMILDKLGDKQKSPDIPDNITFEEFCAGLSSWNERTTTSPSGRHLGHYKILLRLPIYNQSNQNISTKILHSIHQVIQIMSKLGETIPRWCNVSTIMIEKNKRKPKNQ